MTGAEDTLTPWMIVDIQPDNQMMDALYSRIQKYPEVLKNLEDEGGKHLLSSSGYYKAYTTIIDTLESFYNMQK